MNTRLPDADHWLQSLRFEVIWKRLKVLEESIIPPVIMLNATKSPRHQRWLTFHAIAHYKLHTGNHYYMRKKGDYIRLAKQERQAEEWTARLLLPKDDLLAAIQSGMDEDELAERFDVPRFGVELAISLLADSELWVEFEEEGVRGVSRISSPTRHEIDDYFKHEAENRAFARWLGKEP